MDLLDLDNYIHDLEMSSYGNSAWGVFRSIDLWRDQIEIDICIYFNGEIQQRKFIWDDICHINMLRVPVYILMNTSLGICLRLVGQNKIRIATCMRCENSMVGRSGVLCSACCEYVELHRRIGQDIFMLIGALLDNRDVIGVMRMVLCAVL